MLPILIDQVFEPRPQLRLYRAGAVEGVDDQGLPDGTKFYSTAIGGTVPGSAAKVLGPLDQIALIVTTRTPCGAPRRQSIAQRAASRPVSPSRNEIL